MEELTRVAKDCYARANAEAVKDRAAFISSIHLLSALLETPCLAHLDGDRTIQAAVSRAAQQQLPEHDEPLKRALEESISIAREWEEREIGPLLLLLGMMKLEDLRATQIMQEHGLSIDHIEKLTRGVA